jgi:hypothetical protein
MRRFYYDPTRFGTYLEQLGIQYPTLRKSAGSARRRPRCPELPPRSGTIV